MKRLHACYCRSRHWRSTLDRLVPWALADVDLGDHVLELGPGHVPTIPLLRSRTRRVTAIDRFRVGEAAIRVVALYESSGRRTDAAAWKERLGMPDFPANVFAAPE